MNMKLEIGYNYEVSVREVIYNNNYFASLKIMYLSDLHLNRYSKSLISKVIAILDKHCPDLVLLGGDYIDFKSGFIHFEHLLAAIPTDTKVAAVAGNHDYFIGVKRIVKLVEKYCFHWIERQSIVFNIRNIPVQIDGNCMTKPSQVDTNCLRVLCLHKPMNLPLTNAYHFAFAGHLHGCQFVFWENEYGLFPGRLFYKWNVLQKKTGQCESLISRGLGDTLPVRYNCKREVVLAKINLPLQSY